MSEQEEQAQPYDDHEIDMIEQGLTSLLGRDMVVPEKMQPAKMLLRLIAMIHAKEDQLREAQELLRNMAEYYAVCLFCEGRPNMRGVHRPGCPWLAAKQYLETTQPQSTESA